MRSSQNHDGFFFFTGKEEDSNEEAVDNDGRVCLAGVWARGIEYVRRGFVEREANVLRSYDCCSLERGRWMQAL